MRASAPIAVCVMLLPWAGTADASGRGGGYRGGIRAVTGAAATMAATAATVRTRMGATVRTAIGRTCRTTLGTATTVASRAATRHTAIGLRGPTRSARSPRWFVVGSAETVNIQDVPFTGLAIPIVISQKVSPS
jgi:hypothetical protein